jgi:hypothetical protein
MGKNQIRSIMRYAQLIKFGTIKIRSVRWKYMLCGRDKFTHKSSHKCVGGYRKRKIVWQEVQSHCR